MSAAPSCSGWLQKTGEGVASVLWNSRFFQLKDNKLNYYTDQTCRELKGTIDISNIRAIKNTGNGYFEIQIPSRTYYLWAEHTDDATRWISTLNQSVAHFQGKPQQGVEAPPPYTPQPHNPQQQQQQQTPSAPPPQQPPNTIYGDLYVSQPPQINPGIQMAPSFPPPPYSPQGPPPQVPQQQQQANYNYAPPPQNHQSSGYPVPPQNPSGYPVPPQQSSGYPVPPQQPYVYPAYSGMAPPNNMQHYPSQPTVYAHPPSSSPSPHQGHHQKRKFRIKEKLFSLGGDMLIHDEHGHEAFIVRGEIFTIGTKMSFQDRSTNRELAYISQKLRLGMPHYEIYRDGKHYATIKQEFSFTPKFEIEMTEHHHEKHIKVEGDWMAYEFNFKRNGHSIASVSRKLFNISDTYGVEIDAGEDVILILAVAVIIDKCTHHQETHHHHTPHHTPVVHHSTSHHSHHYSPSHHGRSHHGHHFHH